MTVIAVIVLAIGIGMRPIHLLNAQHGARIAAYHFSDPPAGTSRLLAHPEGNTPT